MARRQFNVFNLSFLDVMACGFGAIILFFMIINSQVKSRSNQAAEELTSQTEFLEQEISDFQKRLIKIKNTLEKTEDENLVIEGSIQELLEKIKELTEEISFYENNSLASVESIEQLKIDIETLEESNKRLQKDRDNIATCKGENCGRKQFVSGCSVNGSRVLFLVDSSTSMLGYTYVNALRLSIFPDERKQQSPKWNQVIKGIRWLLTKLDSDFQIYVFNEQARSVIENSEGQWLEANNENKLKAINNLASTIPQKGNSLHTAFDAIDSMDPKPDLVVLFTDGLPTQGRRILSEPTEVNQDTRKKYFDHAYKREFSPSIPTNIFLLPLDGDPYAASKYIQLAQASNGCYVTPARDWPL